MFSKVNVFPFDVWYNVLSVRDFCSFNPFCNTILVQGPCKDCCGPYPFPESVHHQDIMILDFLKEQELITTYQNFWQKFSRSLESGSNFRIFYNFLIRLSLNGLLSTFWFVAVIARNLVQLPKKCSRVNLRQEFALNLRV